MDSHIITKYLIDVIQNYKADSKTNKIRLSKQCYEMLQKFIQKLSPVTDKIIIEETLKVLHLYILGNSSEAHIIRHIHKHVY